MPRIIVFTIGVIALVLLGMGFWWWQGRNASPETAVFQNEAPVLTPGAVSSEAIPLPEEASQEAVAQEIAELERRKEEEYVAAAPSVEEEEKPERRESKAPDITDRLISWGYASKNSRKIDTVVLHSSYNSLGGDQYSLEKIIDIYQDYEVGAHYIIDRRGRIYRLVRDKDVAYHAGASKMPDGRTNVNDFSIGIELINNEGDEYTDDQYDAVNDLMAYLEDLYSIKHVVGHSDIAPSRKTDPWNFDWKKLND